MLDNLYLNDSKLFLLLKALSPKEVKELDLWLASPLHNNSNEVLQLYQNLIHKHRKFDKPINKLTLLNYTGVLNASSARKKMSPKEHATLRQIIFKLTNQIQNYLIWCKSKEDKITAKRHLMDILLERKLYKLVSATLIRSKKELEASPRRDIKYCKHVFQMTEMEFYINTILHNRSSKVNIQEVIDDLIASYISQLLKYYCAAKSREDLLKIKYDYPLIDAVKEYVEGNLNKNIPIIQMYYVLLKLIEEDKPEYYYELKNYLFEHIEAFDIIEIRHFFNFMTNYCIEKNKKGEKQFLIEQHEIYKYGLKLGCWNSGTYFSVHQFINIVLNAIRLDQINWGEAFITKYKERLAPEAKDDILNYSHAMIYFHTKELEKAQDALIKINSSGDFIYHIGFKVLLVKIYYELQELNIDNADSHPINYEVEAIRHYVSTRNKKMSEFLRKSYNNFVNTFKSILERRKKLIYGEALSPTSIKKLQDKLSGISPLVEQIWLKEKIDELLQ